MQTHFLKPFRLGPLVETDRWRAHFAISLVTGLSSMWSFLGDFAYFSELAVFSKNPLFLVEALATPQFWPRWAFGRPFSGSELCLRARGSIVEVAIPMGFRVLFVVGRPPQNPSFLVEAIATRRFQGGSAPESPLSKGRTLLGGPSPFA